MSAETILQDLVKQFPVLEGKGTIQRERRIWVEAPAAQFMEIFEYLVTKTGFTILCTMTGLDDGPTLSFVYHLANQNGTMLNIKQSVPKENPVIRTVTDRFPAAEMYEREVMDLLGAKVEGLPEGRRYPLPDEWPADQFPLRKDWKDNIHPTVAMPEQKTEVK